MSSYILRESLPINDRRARSHTFASQRHADCSYRRSWRQNSARQTRRAREARFRNTPLIAQRVALLAL